MRSDDGRDREFDLDRFLPYLLNQAAERTGRRFEPVYRDAHGLTRTQWRILANLAAYGAMTAAAVSRRTHTEKSKISRAVAALEAEGLLSRTPATDDRRTELLDVTPAGRELYTRIARAGSEFDRLLREKLGTERAATLETMLKQLAEG